jgi:NAD(P)-dependent dehydrogenase (short-subunit alcohol dehydrogenase family)
MFEHAPNSESKDMQTHRSRTAVVIGASSGMGTACAVRLKEEGYRVLVADLSTPRLNELATQLDAESLGIDVSDDASVNSLLDRCRSGIDALVISAGVSMSMAPFERIIDVNLGGSARVLRICRSLINEGGAAVCFASNIGHLVGPIDLFIEKLLIDADAPELGRRIREALPPEQQVPRMAYILSKIGILKLVQRTGVEWGKQGARICSVSPGLIDTPMGSLERKNSPQAEAAVALAPIPRLGHPAEVANVVAFLCSQQASYVTACDLVVDGGWVGAIQSGPADSPFARVLAAAQSRDALQSDEKVL